jgi:uncharacterized membrane protein YedE/YeeE
MDWLSSLIGGILIGISASILLAANGRIAGISGMVAGLLPPQRGDWTFRVWFIAGLMLAGAVASLIAPQLIGAPTRALGWLALAGVLVGAGTRLSGGCTSGHGVCGISRFAPRSIVATIVFMGVAIVTVTLMRLLGAGS